MRKALNLFVLFSTLFGYTQTKFDFDSNTHSVLVDPISGKTDITQTVNGITLTVSSSGPNSEFTQITDFGGFYGTSGNVVTTSFNKNTVTFSFSEPVFIVRLNAANLGGDAGNHVFSDISGNHSDITIWVSPSRNVEILWDNITSFSIDVNISSTPAWDNIIFVPMGDVVTGQTYVPDDNFEQALIDQGYDDVLDNYVDNINIAYEDFLSFSSKGISDFTGIESFQYLNILYCSYNSISSIDVSNLAYLEFLQCSENLLTEIDVTNNPLLEQLYCSNNQISELDVSNNQLLFKIIGQENLISNLDLSNNPEMSLLKFEGNKLTSLDVSQNSKLNYIKVDNNELTSLNIKNGNNDNLTVFDATGNSGLTCIEVDNVTQMTNDWGASIDSGVQFSTNCSSLSTEYIKKLEGVSILPNPVNDVMNIINDSKTKLQSLKIYDISGRIFIHKQLQGKAHEIIKVSDLPSGIYFAELSNRNEMAVLKILKR